MAERILIIEDDPEIQEMLKYAFAKEGWELIQALTGEEGLKSLRDAADSPAANGKACPDHLLPSGQAGADCVILDLMLPGMDGLKVLKKIRGDEALRNLPVIICSARGDEADIVAGLELGADDYVIKPYSPRVLAARVRAGLRRKEELDAVYAKTVSASSNGASGERAVLLAGKLSLDIERHSCLLDGISLDLPATEFAILAHFMSHPDIVFSRQKLITAIRGPDYPVTDRSVDVQILGLRKRLGEAGDYIETIRGVGYRFRGNVE